MSITRTDTGDVTASSSSAAVLLGEHVLSSNGTPLLVTGIPDTSKDLNIIMMIRSAKASDNDTVHIRFGNGSLDTGANYDYRRIWDGSSEGMDGGDSATTIQLVAQVSASTATSGYFGFINMTVPNYATTTIYRHCYIETMHRRGGTTFYQMENLCVWKNTSDPIERIQVWVDDGATSMEAGSFLRVYGV